MKPNTTLAPFDPNDEIPALIETLHLTERRLEELTRGEVDTVVSASGHPFLLRHAEEQLRHGASARQSAILNALPAHIALVDTHGVIISINEAWRRFDQSNAIQGPGPRVGLNYLDICDRAQGKNASEAIHAAAGIRSVLAGEARTFSFEYSCDAPSEQRWFLMVVTPLTGDPPSGAVVMHVNITERRRTELALQLSEARLHLLNDLGEATRALAEPEQIMAVTVRLLGENLQVSRCAYADVDQDGEGFTILHDYTQHCASTVGVYRLSLFGTRSVATLRSGETLVVRDVDAEFLPAEGADMFKAIGISAIITCPLVKDGGLRALMAVHQSTPRDWTPDEIALVKEVAERCWTTLERRKAVAELRASEENFRTLSEAVPEIVWVTSPDGWNLYINQRWVDYTGLTLAESLGHGWIKPFHPDDQQRAQDAWQQALRTGETYSIECRLRRADGVHRWWLIRGEPLRDTAGAILKWFGTCTDIDELKQAQSRITEQAALIDQARDAIHVRDLTGNIIFWNKGAERLYDWTTAEAVGRSVSEVLQPELGTFNVAHATTRRDGAWSGELSKVTRNGAKLTLDSRWTLLHDADGQPKSILSIDTDATERKKLEMQFLRAQRMESIGTLAGGISHDLNNVLAPIMMSIELLKLESGNDPRRERILDAIHVSCCRGADLVRQVLTFARGLDGRRVAVLLPQMINEIEGIISSTFPRNIRVSTEVAPDLWPVIGDPSQLHQVLLNLAVNARDAMTQGGALILTATNLPIDAQYAATIKGSKRGPNQETKPGPYVLLQVIDTGKGMSHETQARIFEPFFTTKPVGQGTGIGLATVHTVVKSHDGFLEVESEPGNGTTFKIFLPADPELRVQQPVTVLKELPKGRNELILVIDDEASILSITQQTLEAFGYSVITAADGAQAVALFARHVPPVSLVLTDMMMPIMDGPATIRVLKSIDRNVRIIAVSGLSDRDNVLRASEAGIHDFLPKPYTAETLLLLVREVLDRPAGVADHAVRNLSTPL
jgi:PAS domain S-box-containing protein